MYGPFVFSPLIVVRSICPTVEKEGSNLESLPWSRVSCIGIVRVIRIIDNSARTESLAVPCGLSAKLPLILSALARQLIA